MGETKCSIKFFAFLNSVIVQILMIDLLHTTYYITSEYNQIKNS